MVVTAERIRQVLDYDSLTGVFSWTARKGRNGPIAAGKRAGTKAARGYLSIHIDGQEYKAHRLAWLYVHGTWPIGQIDHIDRDKTNNAIINLRDVSGSVNMENRAVARRDSVSGLLGASPCGGRWKSQIRVRGTVIYLGIYDTPQDAHTVYIAAKRKLHEGCSI